MDKKDILIKYINRLKKEKLLTEFIAYIFDYKNFFDYNYIFRMFKKNNNVIIDIYDNISDNRFNRYIFDFDINNKKSKVSKNNNVYITYMNINNIKENTKLYKLAHLFSLNKKEMIIYAHTFLKEKYIEILKNIIK